MRSWCIIFRAAMASWFRGLPKWAQAVLSLAGGLAVGSITYALIVRKDKKKNAEEKQQQLVNGCKTEIIRRILVLGLSGVGKSSILSTAKADKEKPEVKPTEGFNVICLQKPNMTLNIWEIGGSDRVKPFWTNFIQNTDLLVFVVDSSEASKISAAKEEFNNLIPDERLHGVPVLLLANKQDIPGAKSPAEVEKLFGSEGGYIQDHPVRVLGTCAAPHLPPHPSVWEAERLMISMITKK